jgi:hypothetical protein
MIKNNNTIEISSIATKYGFILNGDTCFRDVDELILYSFTLRNKNISLEEAEILFKDEFNKSEELKKY